MGMEHYVKVCELGGSNGAFLGYDKQDRERKVVIKRLTSGAQGMEELSALLRVQSFRHLAQIYESFVYRNHLYIVMRYYDGGDLEDKFNELRCRELSRQGGIGETEHLHHCDEDKDDTTNKKNKANRLNVMKRGNYNNGNNNLEGSVQLVNAEKLSLENLRLRLHWAEMIVKAVKCCHEQHIVHRDIKPGNIFVAYSKHEKANRKSKNEISHMQERYEYERQIDYNSECEQHKKSRINEQKTQEWPSSPSPSVSSSSSLSSLLEESLESAKSHTSTSYRQLKENELHNSNSRLNANENSSENKNNKADRYVQLYLGDFGSAKALQSSSLTSTFVGSPLWLAPEVLEGMSYGMPSDIWSLGCVLYEMFTLQRPFHATSFVQLVESVTHGKMAQLLPDSLPHELCTLIMRMLSVNPSTRPTALEVLQAIRKLYHEIGDMIKKQNMSSKRKNTWRIMNREMTQHTHNIQNESDKNINNVSDSNSPEDKNVFYEKQKMKRNAILTETDGAEEIINIKHEQCSYVHSSPSSEYIMNDKSNSTTTTINCNNEINSGREVLESKKCKESLNKENQQQTQQEETKVPLRSVCSFPVISTSSSSTSKWHTKSCSNSYIVVSDNKHINNINDVNDASRRDTNNRKSKNNKEDRSDEVSVSSIKSLSQCVRQNKASPTPSTSVNSSQVANHLNKSQESTLVAVHTNNNSESQTNTKINNNVLRTYVNSENANNEKSHNRASLLPAIKTRSSTCAKPGTSSSSLFSAPTLITADTHDVAPLFNPEEELHRRHTEEQLQQHEETNQEEQQEQPNTAFHKIFNKGSTHNYESISEAVKLEMLDNVTRTAPVVMLRANNNNNNDVKQVKNDFKEINKPFTTNTSHHMNIIHEKDKMEKGSDERISTIIDGNGSNNNNNNNHSCKSKNKFTNKQEKETNYMSSKTQESTKTVTSLSSSSGIVETGMPNDVSALKDEETSNKPKEKLNSLSLLARLSRQTTSSSQKMKISNTVEHEFNCSEEANEDKMKNDEEAYKTHEKTNTNTNSANNTKTDTNDNNNKSTRQNSHSHTSTNNSNNKIWKVEKAPPPVKLAPIRYGPVTSTSSCSSYSSFRNNNSTNHTSDNNSNKRNNSYLVNNTGQVETSETMIIRNEPSFEHEEPQSVDVHKENKESRKSLDKKHADTKKFFSSTNNIAITGFALHEADDDENDSRKKSNNDNVIFNCNQRVIESESTEGINESTAHTTNKNKSIFNEELSSSSSSSSLDTLSSSRVDNTIKNTQPPHMQHLPETNAAITKAIKSLETSSSLEEESALSSTSTSHRRTSLHDKCDTPLLTEDANKVSSNNINSKSTDNGIQHYQNIEGETYNVVDLTSSTSDYEQKKTVTTKKPNQIHDVQEIQYTEIKDDISKMKIESRQELMVNNTHDKKSEVAYSTDIKSSFSKESYDEISEDTWLIKQQQELSDIEHYLMSHEAHDIDVLQRYSKPRRSLRNAHVNMHRSSGNDTMTNNKNIWNNDEREFYNVKNTDYDDEEDDDDDMWYYNLQIKGNHHHLHHPNKHNNDDIQSVEELKGYQSDSNEEKYGQNGNACKVKDARRSHGKQTQHEQQIYSNVEIDKTHFPIKSKLANSQQTNKNQNRFQEIETSWQLNQLRSNNEASRKSPSCRRSNHSPSYDTKSNINSYENRIRLKQRQKSSSSSSPEKQYEQHQNTRRSQKSHHVYSHTQRQASEARGRKVLTQEEEEEANRHRAEARARREVERLNMVKMINERRMQAKRERQEKELQHGEETRKETTNNNSNNKETKENCNNNNINVNITTSNKQPNTINKNKNEKHVFGDSDTNSNIMDSNETNPAQHLNNNGKHDQNKIVNYVVASKKKTFKNENPWRDDTHSRQEGKGKLRKTDVKVEIRLPDNLRYTE